MADIKLYLPKLLTEESSKYTNIPGDFGGPTKYGITLKTLQSLGLRFDKDGDGVITAEDVKLLTYEDFEVITKELFWDKYLADNIQNQSLAELLVDWEYNSGHPGIEIPQGILKLKQDGIVGQNTLSAINNAPEPYFYNEIWYAHLQFYKELAIKHPQDEKFEKGWQNRLSRFHYQV